MQTLHVAVEGTIGAGKTKLMPDAQVLDEPVGDWTQQGLLQKVYENPERFGFALALKRIRTSSEEGEGGPRQRIPHKNPRSARIVAPH
jgi:deoxyadenosine/deoxycytidine kinase